MDPTACLGNFRRLDRGDFEAPRPHLADQHLGRGRRDGLAVTQGHHVAAQIHRVGKRHIDDLVSLGFQPFGDGRVRASLAQW